jgi:hypothetical protein
MVQLRDLLKKTCEIYEITTDEILSEKRNTDLIISRVAFANAAKWCGWTPDRIANELNRSPSMVASYLKSKQKETMLYRRAYNSLINYVKNDEYGRE